MNTLHTFSCERDIEISLYTGEIKGASKIERVVLHNMAIAFGTECKKWRSTTGVSFRKIHFDFIKTQL